MKFSLAFLLKFAGTDSNSCMICARLSDKSVNDVLKYWDKIKEQYPEAKDIVTKKEAHCTLRYWKQDEHNDFDAVSKVLGKLDYPSEIDCEISGLDIFGDDDALVIKINSKELNKIQSEIDKEIQKLGVPPSNYDSFKGHITLAYNIKETPKEKPNINITLNKIQFVDNKDKIFWNKQLDSTKKDVKMDKEEGT